MVAVGACALTLSLGVCGMAATKKAPQWKGSIHVTGRHSDAQLQKMAKISLATAEKTALAAVKAPAADKQVSNHEVEAERGYLVYSIEVTVKGKPGIQEILVDAGNGKVLDRQYESPSAEKGEKD